MAGLLQKRITLWAVGQCLSFLSESIGFVGEAVGDREYLLRTPALHGFTLHHGVQLPADSNDSFDIISLATERDRGLARLLDIMLADLELTAASHATVPGYVHEALAACRDSGRKSAMIGGQSSKVIRIYLEQHAGAICIIPSLADLTLRLRARPLPN